MTIPNARYAHTNLIARDWKALANFYQRAFGCIPVPPERAYAGPALEAATTVPGATLQGIHLRLPGHGAHGPTLEIFTYSALEHASQPRPNRPGYGHIAFQVPSVPEAAATVIQHGGKPLGQTVTLTTTTGQHVTWCYLTDPEGNIIELQSWL